jgi:TRAP-type C4-dicarboxylate transport system substrate-binding protein
MMGTGLQAVDPRVAKLKALGITLSDWARLPGTLRDQILQAADEAAPQEYRTLVQRYFQEVARRGGASAQGTE